MDEFKETGIPATSDDDMKNNAGIATEKKEQSSVKTEVNSVMETGKNAYPAFDSAYNSYTYADEMPKKKNHAALVLIIALVVILAALVSLFFFVPSVNNKMKLAFMTDKSYFASVQNSNAKITSDWLNTAVTEYNAVYKDIETSTNIDYNVGISLEKDFADILQLPKTYKLSVSGNSRFKDGLYKCYNEVLVGNSRLINSDLWYDQNNDKAYFSFPMYSEEVLQINDTKKFIEEKLDADLSEYTIDVSPSPEELDISQQQINSIVDRYNALLLKYCDNVEIVKNTEIKGEKFSNVFNVAKIELTAEQTKALLEEFTEQLENDSDIFEIIKQFDVTKEDYSEVISALKEELSDDIDNVTGASIETYIDNIGKIKGRKITNNYDSYNTSFEYFVLDQNTTIDAEIIVENTKDGNKGSKIVFAGEYEDGTVNGTVKLSTIEDGVLQDFVNADFKDFKIEEGNLSGNSVITVNSDESGTILMNCNFKSDGKKSEQKYEVSLEDKKYFTIDVAYSFIDSEDITLPTNDTYVISDDNVDLSGYFDTFNTDELKETINNELYDLIPEEYAEAIDYIVDYLPEYLNEYFSAEYTAN